MGRVASSVDNTKIKSFSSTMQRDLLDTGTWDTPDQPGSAIFEWIEAWYNPRRQHASISDLAPAPAPAKYDNRHRNAATAA
jgi:putative transposase